MRGKLMIFNPTSGTGSPTSTQQLIRMRDGRSHSKTLEPASERGVESADDGTWTTRLEANGTTLRTKRSMPRARGSQAVDRRLRLILANYRVSYDGEETCAGRKCFRVTFLPRHPMSRKRVIWVDQATGVDLWYQESDSRGNTLCLMIFLAVQYPRSISSSEIALDTRKVSKRINISRFDVVRDIGKVRLAAGFPVAAPLSMPAGYVFDLCTLVTINNSLTACLRYTDGLSTITICETKNNRVPSHDDRPFRAVNLPLGEAVVDLVNPGVDIRVVGHADPKGLLAVAGAIDTVRERFWVTQLSRKFGVAESNLYTLRNRGLCMEAIATALKVCTQRGNSMTQVVGLYGNGLNWREVARRYSVTEADVLIQLGVTGKP